MRLFVFRSKIRTFEFSSAVTKRRLPATSGVKWSKSPSWSSGSGVECKSLNGAFSCAETPIMNARIAADKIIAFDGFKWILQFSRSQTNLKPALKIH